MHSSDITQRFDEITGLKWYPYVGDRYWSLPEDARILLVLESQYKKESDPRSDEMHKSKTFSRQMVDHFGRNANRNKMYDNLFKTLAINPDMDRRSFWDTKAFHNLVQRSMSSSKEHPTKSDFEKGWEVLPSILQILKPSVCIFGGNTAGKYLNGFLEEPKINGMIPRTGFARIEDVGNIPCYFMAHPSAPGYEVSEWRKWIGSKLPEKLNLDFIPPQ